MITRKEVAIALYEFDATLYGMTYDFMGYKSKAEAVGAIFKDMYENFLINKEKNILVRRVPSYNGSINTITYQIDLKTKKIIDEIKFEEKNIMKAIEI